MGIFMKQIALSKTGKRYANKYFALVDDEDYDYLNQWKWCAKKDKTTYYAMRTIWINGKPNGILMHRLVIKANNGMMIDHKDMNGLNNQKFNLRICTQSQNRMNGRARGKSKYLGVCYRDNKYIMAVISINGKQKKLGTFKTEEEAAKRYDEFAKIYHGEYANLNFK